MLPKIDAPTYTINLPVSKTELIFRPFLVKEQKILLMAMESQDEKTVETNIRQILQNCVITDIDINKLPMVDVEYYYLNLRAKSVGEVIETKYKCENDVGGKPCGTPLNISYNILEVDIKIPDVKDNIAITGKVGVKMRYPSFEVLEKMKQTESLTDISFEFILACIDYIYDEDAMYYSHEIPREEIIEFLDSLTKEQFDNIEKFIDNVPTIEKKVEIKCPGCGFDHSITIKDLNGFFQ